MKVRLYSGQIEGGQPVEIGTTMPAQIDRACRFVYDGIFNSMDGEVRITPALMRKIAASHNSRVLAAGGDLPIGSCPPVQLDHTKSARDTVGRVVGLLNVVPQMIDGELKDALVGTVRFLGSENVERAVDGRYSNVSIGADLSTGELSELSVTPFPAAPRASLLSRGSDEMDKEKLKKHLMESTKCSAEEADERLSKMSDDDQKKLASEVDEKEKKLAAEEDEKAKKLAADEEEKKKELARASGSDAPHPEPDGDEAKRMSRLAAAGPKLSKLMGEANEAIRLAKLEAKRVEVGVQLSKFRAQGVLSPAEEKKLAGELKVGGKTIRLAEASDEAIALAFAILEAREPVVHLGQVGTVKPVDLSQMGEATKKARLANDEKVSLSNMPFLRAVRMNAGGKKKGGAETEEAPLRPADAVALAQETTTVMQSDATIEAQQKQLAALQEQITKLSAFTSAIAEVLA